MVAARADWSPALPARRDPNPRDNALKYLNCFAEIVFHRPKQAVRSREDEMKTIRTLTVFLLSLGLAISTFGSGTSAKSGQAGR